MVIQTTQYWQKNKQIDQCNRIESPEIDPYNHLIFDKGAKAIQWRKDSIFNNWTSTCKKPDLDTNLTSFTKINSKWIRDLKVKHKTIKLLEDNTEENLNGLWFGDDFLHRTPMAWSMKELTSWTSLKWKISTLQKTVKRMKRQARDWEKMFVKDITCHQGHAN